MAFLPVSTGFVIFLLFRCSTGTNTGTREQRWRNLIGSGSLQPRLARVGEGLSGPAELALLRRGRAATLERDPEIRPLHLDVGLAHWRIRRTMNAFVLPALMVFGTAGKIGCFAVELMKNGDPSITEMLRTSTETSL